MDGNSWKFYHKWCIHSIKLSIPMKTIKNKPIYGINHVSHAKHKFKKNINTNNHTLYILTVITILELKS